MSTTGQALGAVVGGVAGFFVAGPVGALQGAALGAGIGAALDPPKGPTVEGPRLSDLKIQTSTLGQGIPRFHGTIAVSGNIIWLENNQLRETVRKEKQGGGKGGGGGSQTVRTYSYSATFALCLGEGPISGIRRIWCSDKLIYNAGSDDLETIIASNQAARGMRFYYGTDDQLPDSRIEAEMGVGNAPAFRGRVYIVFDDFQLADYSNTLQAAQFKVEIMREASYALSNKAEDISIISNEYEKGICAIGGGAKRFVATSAVAPWFTTEQHQVFTSYFGSSSVSQVITGSGYLRCKSWQSSISEPFYQRSSTNVVVSGGKAFPVGSVVNQFYLQVNGDKLYCHNASGIYLAQHSSIFSIPTISVAISGVVAIFLHGSSLLAFRNGQVRVYSADDLSLIEVISTSAISSSSLRVAGEDGNIYISNSPSLTSVSKLSSDYLSIEETYTMPSVPGIAGDISFNVVDGVIHRAAPHSTENGFYYDAYVINGINVSSAELSSILIDECLYSSLIDNSDIDVSLINESVPGYVVSGGTIRAALEPLQAAYPFDAISSGYKIKFVPRGQSSVASIPIADLGATDSDSVTDVLTEQREMDTQLPAKTVIKYIDALRDYDQSEQVAERINTQAVNKVERELPIVMSADKAAGVAEVLHGLAWLERNDYSFTLPPSYGNLETSDVVTVAKNGVTYELLLRSLKYRQSGVLECSAKLSRAALYAPVAQGGEVPGGEGTVPLIGASVAVLLDIPVVDESVQNATGFIAALSGRTDGWPGAILVRSPDSGQTFTDIQAFVGKSTIGTALDSLTSSGCTVIDSRTLKVQMVSGTLSSITRDQMLSGAHYAAYGADGRWEIVRYQNATLNSDGSYSVSGFVRGEKGTEWATGLHQVGDWFVVLDDPDNAFIGMAAESIGVSFDYRAVTSGDSVDDADNIDFTYRGVNLECLSPVYASGARDGSNNFSGTFTRRSRLTGTWWTTGTPTPIGETSEAYEIDVMNGSTVVRTISVTSPSFSYSAANQAADFGSAQSSITFRIYQMSGIVGRGYPLEVTL